MTGGAKDSVPDLLRNYEKGGRGPCFLHGPVIYSVLKIMDYYEQYFERNKGNREL